MTKIPLVIGNICKLADIDLAMISDELHTFLQGKETWRDLDLGEDIYDVDRLTDKAHDESEYSNTHHIPAIIMELEAIGNLLNDNDCGYFRVIVE